MIAIRVLFVAMIVTLLSAARPQAASFCLYGSEAECGAACDAYVNSVCNGCYQMWGNYCAESPGGCWETVSCSYSCFC